MKFGSLPVRYFEKYYKPTKEDKSVLKRFLAVALAAAMILGLASTAFAAVSFSDTAGDDREAAINQLAGLGLLNGYEDGTFRPGNPITRAEFAAVICRALGLEDAAELMEGLPTSFTDVAADHWASGYINIATSQGIINGYPNGSFMPSKQVSYAEALAMILRALGYEPVLKNGVWPTAYVMKAASLGVSKGVNFKANDLASRGDVAALVSNALTVPMMEQTGAVGEDPTWAVNEDLNLLVVMGATKVEGWLIASPDLFDADFDGKIVVLDAENAEIEKPLAEGTDASGLLGHKVTAWLNSDGEVFFVQDKTDSADVKAAKFSRVVDDRVYVEIGGKDVNINGLPMFLNYQEAKSIDANTGLNSEHEIVVIYDGKDPAYVVALRYEYRTVKSVNTIYSRVSFHDGATVSFDDYEVAWYGDAEDFSDLEEFDVVQYIRSGSSDKRAVIIVTRDSVTGKFTRLSGSNATIGGNRYSVRAGVSSVSTSLFGKQVTAYLNKDGKIQYMKESSAESGDKNIGIVVKYGELQSAYDDDEVVLVKLFTADGSLIEVEASSDFSIDGRLKYKTVPINKGDVVEYAIDDEELVDITLLAAFAERKEDISVNGDHGLITDTYHEPTVTSKITADTVVFDLSDWTLGSEKDLVIGSIEDLDFKGTMDGIVAEKEGRAVAVCLFGSSAQDDDALYGYVVDKFEDAEGDGIVILRAGTEAEYLYSDNVRVDSDANGEFDDDIDDIDDIAVGNVVMFKTAAGKLSQIANVKKTAATKFNPEADELRVTYVDDDVIEITAYDHADEDAAWSRYLPIDKNTLFYDETDGTGDDAVALDLDEVGIGVLVDIYEADGVLKVLVILPETD